MTTLPRMLRLIAVIVACWSTALAAVPTNVRAKLEKVRLDPEVQEQVNRIDGLQIRDLPEQYRNRGYLQQMAKTMFEKAMEAYRNGIDLASLDADSERPLPSQGQAGAQFQQGKLLLRGGDKYLELARQL